MLDKFKIAFVLLLIGGFSGLAIVGVHTLTEDFIQENRLAAQNEAYLEIFPNMSVSDMETESFDEGVIRDKITVYDGDGNHLGYIFVGVASGFNADNTVIVGVDTDNVIIDVIISATDDTPNYVNNLRDNYLPNLRNQMIFEMSYDANTGATGTYNSVVRVIDAASLLLDGDPTIDLYGEFYPDIASYTSVFVFEDRMIEEEVVIKDEDGTILGYAYLATIDDETVYLMLDADDKLLGFVGSDDYEAHIGEHITDITVEGEAAIDEMVEDVQHFVRHFIRIDEDHLVRYRPQYDGDDMIGYVYTGWSEGFAGMNEIEIILNLDGEIRSVDIIRTNDTPGYVADALDGVSEFYDLDSLDGVDTDDVFSGVTGTGDSIVNATKAAIAHFNATDHDFSDILPIEEEVDPFDQLFGDALEAYATYESYYDYRHLDIEELSLFDGEGTLIGQAFVKTEDEQLITIVVDPSQAFVALYLDDLRIEAYDTHEGSLLADIDLEGDEVTTVVFEAVIDFFKNTVRTDDDVLIRMLPIKDNDEVVAYRYFGKARGFAGDNFMSVDIDLDGIITNIDMLYSNDSPGYIDDAIDWMDGLHGMDDITDVEADDMFSGVSASGQSILDVVDAAIQYFHAEEGN